MIVVDSSVWIDYFNGKLTWQTEAVHKLAGVMIVIGDLIITEVLRGFSNDSDFRRAEAIFATLNFQPMLGRHNAVAAARNYRTLRRLGLTVPTIDTLIATFCITGGYELLHCDRDFDCFEQHLGLRVVRS